MQQDESYGQNLPDQVDSIATLFDAHISLIADIHDIYRDRAALEREYAAKLQLQLKKATEKKNKAVNSLVAGDNPTKACSDHIIQENTFVNAYTQIITSMSKIAQDHIQLADTIATQVTEPLKALERRNEGLRRKQSQFYQKLLSEREHYYVDRLKNKQKECFKLSLRELSEVLTSLQYDDECTQVDMCHQKQAQQDRHADRAARQYEEHQNDMLTSKNVYLISIAVANKVKDKFYTEDLRGLEDTYQEMQTRLVRSCASILLQAQTIQVSHEDALKERLASVTAALEGLEPHKDQKLFIDLNIRPFSLPNNWNFEPCTSHYDTDKISLETSPKVFLQNKLARLRKKLEEQGSVLNAKLNEVEKYTGLIASCSGDDALGNVDDAMNGYLDTQHQATFSATSVLALRTEIDTIAAALGDDEGGSSPHDFKSSSFPIATKCGYCKASMWGLSKIGKTCRACGLSVHTKCELKVPAECTGVLGGHTATQTPSRASSTISRKETGHGSPRVSFLGRPTSTYSSAANEAVEEPTVPSLTQDDAPQGRAARVAFDFAASSPFELSVSIGMTIHVLEEDDGSGWVKVIDSHGGKGLVPASYLETADVILPELSGSSEEPRASGQFVRVLYDYEAQGADELSVREGEMLKLSYDGQGRTDGWWEGYSTDGRKGIFPSNYVELA